MAGVNGDPLTREFFLRPVDEVAADIIGCLLFTTFDNKRTGGIIVDVEAYDECDPAAHCHPSHIMASESTAMKLEGGHAYVCEARGMAWLNLTCDRSDFGSAILIGAIQPVEGLETMRQRRLHGWPEHKGLVNDRTFPMYLCRGPAVTAEALGIGPAQDKASLFSPPFSLYRAAQRPDVLIGPRINVIDARCEPRRYVMDGSKFVRWQRHSELRPLERRTSPDENRCSPVRVEQKVS